MTLATQPTPEPDRITGYTTVDQIATGLASFYSMFANKPLIRALATTYLTEIQAVETALWDILTQTGIANAIGQQLDQVGELLGFPRGNLVDTDYRAILFALVRARRSLGRPEDVIAVAELALESDALTYNEGAADVWIEPGAPVAVGVPAALEVIGLSIPGGVGFQLFTPPTDDASKLFTFSSDPYRAQTDSNAGFSDTSQITGGLLTGVAA